MLNFHLIISSVYVHTVEYKTRRAPWGGGGASGGSCQRYLYVNSCLEIEYFNVEVANERSREYQLRTF